MFGILSDIEPSSSLLQSALRFVRFVPYTTSTLFRSLEDSEEQREDHTYLYSPDT